MVKKFVGCRVARAFCSALLAVECSTSIMICLGGRAGLDGFTGFPGVLPLNRLTQVSGSTITGSGRWI
jgi:hypothetical protein